MKIAFVCFYEAYPPASGAASVSYDLARYTKGERILIQFGAGHCRQTTTDGVSVLTLPGTPENRVKRVLALPNRLREILKLLGQVSPDVVVLEGASWVLYHLMLLRKVRARLPGTRIIFHAHNVEYHLRRQKHGAAVVALTKACEARLLRESDASFAVSENDADQFETLYGIRPRLLPNAVDVNKFSRVTPDQTRAIQNRYDLSSYNILFMGSYLYRPNRDGIDFLVERVMPRVLASVQSARLTVIGGQIPYKRAWLKNPGMVPHNEIPAFVSACSIGTAPIFLGSGTRLKILEYLAAGLPVVTTSKGAEGLVFDSNRDMIVAEREEEFAAAIVQILGKTSLAKELGSNGRALVNQLYSWDEAIKEFQKTIEANKARS